MPAWITPLLRVLVSSPGRGWRSSTHVENPRAAMARAEARPVTPAPITATSIRSTSAAIIRFLHFLALMTPRRDARARPFESGWYLFFARAAAPAAALALLVVMIALSRDFGATWDERALQKLGELIWDLYNGRMSRAEFLGTFELNFGYTRIYGLFVEFLSAAAQQVIPGDLWVVRHYVNAVFGWTGIVFAFLMARRFFGVRAGWLAAALLACMPRYMADSMNNPKDLPFAVLMLAASYYILSVKEHYPYFSWPHALKLGAAIALAVNVRSMGLLLLGYTGLALAMAILAARDFDPRRLAATAGRFAVITLVALIGGAAFWPWAQEQPLTRPIEAFFLASGFSWGNPSLFMGEAISGTAVPWYYLPTWIGITIPGAVLIGMTFAGARLAFPAPGRARLAALWLLVLFPAVSAMVRHVSLYDGIRHMLFIVPPMAVLAAAGWEFLLRSTPGRGQLIVAGALALMLAEPFVFQIRNHPHQAVYFTPAAGGPRGAFGRYDLDYWGNCILEATEWAASQAARAGMPLGVASNAWEVAAMDAGRFNELYFRQQRHAGWHLNLLLLKGSTENIAAIVADPGVLYRVETADGTPLCVVLPGPEYPQIQARLAAGGSLRNQLTGVAGERAGESEGRSPSGK